VYILAVYLNYPYQLFNCRIELEWLCLGNPNAHHDVMPCAPEKIPEFSLQVNVIPMSTTSMYLGRVAPTSLKSSLS